MGKYEEALERAKAGKPLDEVFPELKESEDEKFARVVLDLPFKHEADYKFVRAYLEKQKEQKLSTPQDIAAAYQMGLATGRKEQKPLSTEEIELNSIAFLEQLGYTCVPPGVEQKPAEWSEGTKKALDEISDYLKYKGRDEDADFIRHLRPRPHWKPSEEQMEALLWCTAHLGGVDHRVLAELYEHLKMYCL